MRYADLMMYQNADEVTDVYINTYLYSSVIVALRNKHM